MQKMNAKQIYEELAKMDFSQVDFKAKEELGTKDLARIQDEAKKFYALCVANEKGITPSEVIDTYWHHMVLKTVFYKELGDKFGKFVDHSSSSNDTEAKMKDYFDETIELYKESFGEPDKKIWAKPATCCDYG